MTTSAIRLGLLAVLMTLASMARAVDVEAGPIWNHDDAKAKCPNVCVRAGGVWDGNWRTTRPDMSVCSCSDAKGSGGVQGGVVRYENTDFPYGDLPDGRSDARSFEDCANQCIANTACIAFTYSPGASCYKKSSTGQPMSVQGAVSGVIAGRGVAPPSQNAPPPAAIAAPAQGLPYIRYDRADMPFNDIAELDHPARNFDDCAQRCLADRRCAAFTFNNSSRACKGKSTAAPTAPNEYVSTGVLRR